MPLSRVRFVIIALALALTGGGCGDDSNPMGPVGTQFAVAYVNADSGLATANADVAASSDCDSPDQEDTQQLSDPGSNNRNVHVDACLAASRDGGGTRFDGMASFEASGVGVISACPDPDGAGPKTATLSGSRCTQSGYQSRGAAGDNEYHLRVNNNTTAGDQTITFCFDPEGDGCGNASASSRVVVHWRQ